MLNSIRRILKRRQMAAKGDTVIVGLSGGADSTCLLDVLDRLKGELGIRLAAAHFDHGIRGESGLRDAEFAGMLAEDRSLDFFLGSGNVPELARREGLSVETAARRARYEFFDSLPEKLDGVDPGKVKIALGHTADDQAETVVMRLLRGSGFRGLGGIPPVRGRYIRPLIETSRKSIIEYLKSRELSWMEDETNLSDDYLRNRVRNELLPALIEKYNPNLVDTLVRTANACRETADLMEAEAKKALDKCKLTEDGLLIPRKLVRDKHPAMAMAVIEAAIEKARGTLWAVRSDHRVAVLEAALKPGTSKITLPGGIEAEVGAQWIRLGAPAVEMEDVCVPLKTPGITEIAALGVTFEATIIYNALDLNDFISPPEVAHFDMDTLEEPLEVRNFRPGDRFQPFGMDGERKLQDLFVDLKVPRPWRRRIPIVTAGGKIIWVAPFRMAHPNRVAKKTRRVLRLSISGLTEPQINTDEHGSLSF